MAFARRQDSLLLRWVTVVLLICHALQATSVMAQDAGGPTPPPADVRPLPSAGQPAAAPVERVLDIVIVGNSEIKREKVLNNIGTRIDRPFDQTVYEADVRKLSGKGWFVHVRPKVDRVPGGVVVTFEVVERPVLQYVQYMGHHKFSTSKLAKETGLKKGSPLDPYAVQDGARKIETMYQAKGFNDVKVTVLEGTKNGDRGAVYLINEGRIQKFSKVYFVGNTVAPDGRLKTLIQSKPPILWVFKGQVDRKKIEEDVDKLYNYYRGLGYFKAHIQREYDFNEREDRMTLTFHIVEGPRYKVRNISFIGNEIYPSEVLGADLKQKPGEYFNQANMNRDMGNVKDLYGSHGYVFAETVPDLQFFPEPGELDLVYQVKEGMQYRVGDISVEIKGDNPHTRFKTVLNRTSMRPGDIADIRQFRSTERRLKAAGIYNVDPSKGEAPRVVFSPPDGEESVANKQKRPNTKRTGNPDSFRGQSPDSPPISSAKSSPTQANYPPAIPGAYPNSPYSASPTTAQPGSPVNRGPSAAPAYGASPYGSPAGVATPGYATQSQPVAPQGNIQPQGNQAGAAPQYRQQAPAQQPRGAAPSNVRTAPQRTPPASNDTNGVPGSLLAPPSKITVRGQSPDAYGAYGGSGAGYGGRQLPAGPQPVTSNQPVVSTAQTTGPYAAQPGPGSYAPPPGQPGGIYTPPPPLLPPPGGFLDGPDPGFSEQPSIPVTIVTSEAQTGKFMIGAGINSNAGLVGNIVIDEQNFDWRRVPTSWEDFRTGRAFRGAGQRFRIEAAPGTVVQRYMFSFSDPFLFDTRVSFGLSGFYYNRYFRDWVEQRTGGRTSLGYQFSPDLSGTFAVRAEDVLISQPRVQGVPALDAVLGHTQLYGFSGTMAHDTRDSTFLPTEGHYIDAGFEYVIGTFQYPRFTTNYRKHFLLRERPDGSGRHTLSFYNQFGIAGDDTPIYERFFAGGFSSLRGFQFRGVGPQVNTVEVGGDFQNLSSLEYMFPITADDMLKGVVFVDFGTVEPNLQVNWENFRVAPGVGFRITIPMISPAPIALDFAVPVAYAQDDLRQVFSFFVGVGR